MKTKRIIFPFVALAFMIFLVSCNEQNEVDSYDYIANAGLIHNQLLDNYYQNRSNSSPDSEELISEIITLSTNFLISEGYNSEAVLNNESILKEKYKPTTLKSILNSDFSINTPILIEQIKDMEMYSDKFINALEDVISRLGSDTEIDSLDYYVSNIFSTLVFDNEIDRDGQALFVNIFRGSNEYWTEEYDSNLKDLKIHPTTWVIINDGVGGVLGSIFGPIGSIVTAATFSAATNEEIH